MPAEEEAKSTRKLLDPDNPQTPFEKEMLAAREHARHHITDGYDQAMECGLNESAAKSAGVILALTDVIAYHLMQHGANAQLTRGQVDVEVETIAMNIKQMLEDRYELVRSAVLLEHSQQETKH